MLGRWGGPAIANAVVAHRVRAERIMGGSSRRDELEAPSGFEPENDGFAVRCLTILAKAPKRGIISKFLTACLRRTRVPTKVPTFNPGTSRKNVADGRVLLIHTDGRIVSTGLSMINPRSHFESPLLT